MDAPMAAGNAQTVADPTNMLFNQLKDLFAKFNATLRRISPGLQAALSSIVAATVGTGLVSYKLGAKQPGKHAFMAMVASSIIGLLWLMQHEGTDRLRNTWTRLITEGVEGAERGTIIDNFHKTLSGVVDTNLSRLQLPGLVQGKGNWAIMIVPLSLTQDAPSSDGAAKTGSGYIKVSNHTTWNSVGKCPETLWLNACEEFVAMATKWMENRGTHAPLPILACLPTYYEPSERMKLEPSDVLPPHNLNFLEEKGKAVYEAAIQVSVQMNAILAGSHVDWDPSETTPGYAIHYVKIVTKAEP